VCTKTFSLVPGAALDPSIVPPALHPAMQQVHVRWSAVVTYRFANLDSFAVTSGLLDPVVAMAPIDQVVIAYRDVVSLAAWRKIAWTKLIAAVLLPTPVALLLFWGAIAARSAPVGALILGGFGVLFAALAALLIRSAVVGGLRFVRVIGRYPGQTLTVQLEKQPFFYDQLFRRCGVLPPAS
jgi:hypothetical protein